MGNTTTTRPAEIAGLPTERLAPMRDGSVREYDRPFFAEAEGVGRFQDPEAVRIHTHPPGSDIAEAIRPIMEERNKPRPATRADAHQHDEIARILECTNGDPTQAKRHRRRAWMIRRHLNAQRTPPLPEPRPTGLASPRERRYRRSSSPSRAGPSDDEGPSDEPPPAGRLCENLDCTRGPDGGRADISHLKSDAYYCDDGGACKQAAYRAGLTRAVAERRFGEVAWELRCKHPRDHGQFAPDGVCFACGHPRVPPTVGWYDGPTEHRSFVSASAPKRQTPRLGDRKPKPVRKFVEDAVAA